MFRRIGDKQCYSFQNYRHCFSGYFDLEKRWYTMNIGIFQGDLTDYSSKRRTTGDKWMGFYVPSWLLQICKYCLSVQSLDNLHAPTRNRFECVCGCSDLPLSARVCIDMSLFEQCTRHSTCGQLKPFWEVRPSEVFFKIKLIFFWILWTYKYIFW